MVFPPIFMPSAHIRPSDDIMLRLREETRTEHAATEDAVDIPAHLAGREPYRQLLARFHGFYEPIERALAANESVRQMEPSNICLAKSGWIGQDLLALGMEANEIAQLPRCNSLPSLDGLARQMGCLYVIEGSMLGGQIILRNVAATLGIGPDDGARFFYGYGSETGRQWRTFGNSMRTLLAIEHHDMAVQAAKDTFNSFRHWVAR